MSDAVSPLGSVPDSEWFREIAEGSGLIFFALRVHPDVAYEFVSDALATLLGVSPADAVADAEAVHSRIDPHSLDTLLDSLTTQPGQQNVVELSWLHCDGSTVHSRCWLRARRRSDGSVVLDGTVSVISELRDVEEELRRSERRNRLLVENAWEVVWTMAPDATITFVSPAVERMRGITPAEAMRQSVEEANTPESAAIVADYFARLFAAIAEGSEPPTFRGEIDYYRKDGSIMNGELQVVPHMDQTGKVVEILGVSRDISERKAFEAELRNHATKDPVTGLWNRRHGTELMLAEMGQTRHDGRPLALLMIDIDQFKSINDTHGHLAGDHVLIELARRLREAVRTQDMVARWGGEEFVVMLGACGLDDAVATAEKIRSRIAEMPVEQLIQTPRRRRVRVAVTVSIGATELETDDTVDSWLRRADKALYEAKRSGRNAVAVGSLG